MNPASLLLENIEPTKKAKLEVPKVMEMLIPANIVANKMEPQFKNNIIKDWFTTTIDDCAGALKAKATGRAFFFKHKHEVPKPTWTGFNEYISDVNPEKNYSRSYAHYTVNRA